MSSRFTAAQYDALPEVLTAAEVATILDTSERQVIRWAASGEIPAVQLGRMWRFSKTRIETLISSGTPPHAAP